MYSIASSSPLLNLNYTSKLQKSAIRYKELIADCKEGQLFIENRFQERYQASISQSPQIPNFIDLSKRSSISKDNNRITLEDCAERFHAFGNPDMRAQVARLLKTTTNMIDSGSLSDLECGLAIINQQQLAESLHLSNVKPLCLIICGNQSVGKTTILECLFGLRIGYSSEDRATVCPVIYMFQFDPTAKKPMFVTGKAVDQVMTSSNALPVEQLSKVVEAHMKQIMSTKPGISEEPFYVKLISSDFIFSGVVIDCPGTIINTKQSVNDAVNEEEEKFLQAVKKIITQRVQQSHPEHSVVICVEDRRKTKDEASFYTTVLKDCVPDKKKIIRVFTMNDDGYACTQKEEDQNHINDFTHIMDYGAVGKKMDEALDSDLPQPYFISLKGVGDMHRISETIGMIDIRKTREDILENNSTKLWEVFMKSSKNFKKEHKRVADFIRNPEFVRQRFSFQKFREEVFEKRNRGVLAVLKETVNQVDKLRNTLTSLAKEGRLCLMQASYISTPNVIEEAFNEFQKIFLSIAGNGETVAEVPWVDNRFDMELGHLQNLFPEKLVDGGSHRGYELKDTLKISGVALMVSNDESSDNSRAVILQRCHEKVDGFEEDSLNLSGAFRRMVNVMIVSFASVSMGVVGIKEFVNSCGQNGQHAYLLDPIESARRVASKAWAETWNRFLTYMQMVITHFLTRAVDLCLLTMRIKDKNPPMLATQERPLAIFRYLLKSGLERFVEERMKPYFQRLTEFMEETDDKVYDSYSNHVDEVSTILKQCRQDNHIKEDLWEKMQDNLLSVFDKSGPHSRGVTHVSYRNFANRDEWELLAKTEAIRFFQCLHSKMILDLQKDWTGRFYDEIFHIAPKNENRRLTNTMEYYARSSICNLEFRSPDSKFNSLKNVSECDKNIEFIEPIDWPTLHEKLEDAYGFVDVSAKQKKAMELISVMLKEALLVDV